MNRPIILNHKIQNINDEKIIGKLHTAIKI